MITCNFNSDCKKVSTKKEKSEETIFMSKAPYLHPAHRTSTTDVGSSPHQSTYNKGVLLGNWYEDRLPHAKDNFSWPVSTAKSSFQPTSVAPRTICVTHSLARELLFGTLNGANASTRSAITEDVNKSTNAIKSIPSLQKKRQDWHHDNDPDATPMVTSTSLTTATMKRAELNGDTHTVRGNSRKTTFSATHVDDHRSLGLRG